MLMTVETRENGPLYGCIQNHPLYAHSLFPTICH